jgi:hypothetical protein
MSTLKEIIWDIIKKPQTNGPDELEKIKDDYAIEFAEWVIDYSFNGMYSNDINELLKEFKKEKKL